MEDRLIDIETTLAHQGQQIAEMSDVITDQWKQIEALKARLLRLDDKIEQVHYDRSDGDSSLDSIEKARQDKPPHY